MISYGWKRKKISFFFFILFFFFIILSGLKALGLNTSALNPIFIIVYFILLILSIYFGFILKQFPEMGGSTHPVGYFAQPNNINVKSSYKGNKAAVMGIAVICFSTVLIYWLLFI